MKIKGHKESRRNGRVAGLHGHPALRWQPGQRERAEYRIQVIFPVKTKLDIGL